MRLDWRIVLKALGGFVTGLVLWTALSPLYTRATAAGAEWLLRSFEKPAVTRLVPVENNYVTVERSDFAPGSKRPGLPVSDLTFNFLLLTALFAATPKIFTDRNVGGFVGASVVMFLTHVLALVANVMSVYTNQLGLWSRVNYGEISRNFWGVVNHSYRLVLMYAVAFGLWWIFRDSRTADGAPAKKKKARRKA